MAPMPVAGSQGFGPMSGLTPQGPRSPAPVPVGPRGVPSHWGFGTPSGKDPLLSQPPEQQTERPEAAPTNDDVDIDEDDADSHHDHHELWMVKAIEANPWRLLFGGFGCLLSCFLLIAILLLMGVRILDPRPNDIVPVILREHIAKKRQDAGRSIKEVALACPGCEHLEERSERMFYLHIIYEVERESGTLWETDILRRIHDIERKIFEARGLGPDGKEWAFTDMCLLVKPDEQLKILGRAFSDEPRCAFALSPLLFLADTMLPLADPPPFKMQSTVRNGYVWINETHHAWTDAVSRCAVPPEDAQKESLSSVSGSWLMKRAISYYDKNKLGLDPKESIVESWCASSPTSLPQGMSNCGCLALVYNDVQLSLNWDISLKQMWDFEYGFKKLLRPEADAFVKKVIEYWTSYDDDSVELCRRGSESCPWKNVGKPNPKPWSNKACNDGQVRRRSILSTQECGDLTGDYAAHAFYARRRAIDRVVPHPFVLAVPLPFYTTISADQTAEQKCVPSLINRRRSWGSCSCRRRSGAQNLPAKGWSCNGKRIEFTGENLGNEQLFLFPIRFPNLFSVVGDDAAGACEVQENGICVKRNLQVKSMHSLFFFGFPLTNVNPAWTGLTADKGRNEASDYIMEWVFNTYNDLLVNEDQNAKGFKMSFDANSMQNGSPLLKQYIAYNIPRDAVWITASILFMLTYISFTTKSIFLGVCIIAMIVFSFGPAILLYTLVFQQRYMGLLHLSGLFIILGVGVDDAFVIMDAYGQEKAEAEAEKRRTNFSAIMSPAAHHASKACLCTSLTTFFAFFSNATSNFPSIRTFGLFCACLIISNFLIDFSFFLTIVCANERLKSKPMGSGTGDPSKNSEEAEALRPIDKWFHDTFFVFVKSFRLPLLGIFAFFAMLCMYTATFVTPDPKMPQVFSSKDNYERFLPTLAKRYEQKFNPFRLKVRVHIGINATDPIDRGTTPDYNDCFFNCAGQKPNYVDIFASAGGSGKDKSNQQKSIQRVIATFCDFLEEAAEPDESGERGKEEGDFSHLRMASEADLGGQPSLKCVLRDFKAWTEKMNAASTATNKKGGRKEYPSGNFCCEKDSDFVQFLEAPMPPENKTYQAGSRNMEHFQDEVFFDRIDGALVLRAVVIEIALKATWEIPYEDGIKLDQIWERFVGDFAARAAKTENLPDLPDAMFATDMFAFHWFYVQEAMNAEVFDGIKLSLFLAFLVLLFATGNILLAAISVSCIIAIVSSVLAFAVCMGWKTSVSEAVIYVMVIGLSVDYVIHLGDAYLECPDEKREDRVQFMVTKMGVSVISGAISSAGAALFMMFCRSLFLVKFGMVICYVISVSVVTSLVFFSAMLLVVGPSGETGSLTACWRNIRRRLPCFKQRAEEEEQVSEPQKPVQPRLYSSVVRYRKSLARASMAHLDARALALQLGHEVQPTEIELSRLGQEDEPSLPNPPDLPDEKGEKVEIESMKETGRADSAEQAVPAVPQEAGEGQPESDTEIVDLRDMR